MPLDDVDPARPARSLPLDRAVRVPLRRYQVMTAAAGLVSAAAVGGVLALQRDPAYVRSVLETRMWGVSEVSEADVAGMLTPPWGVPLAVLGVLAFTAFLWWGAARLLRPTRWIGTVAVLMALLTALSWSVDAPRMVDRGGAGAAVLLAVFAMAVFTAVWLLVAHRRVTRDAFDG